MPACPRFRGHSLVRGLVSALKRAPTRRVQTWAASARAPIPDTTTFGLDAFTFLPTGVGLIFGLMVFAMLLGSMNYNNNLSFVLTFFLIGLGFVAMHQCQRNLVGLELTFAGADPVFAGQAIRFRVAVTNQSKSARYGIRLYAPDTAERCPRPAAWRKQSFILPCQRTSAAGYRCSALACALVPVRIVSFMGLAAHELSRAGLSRAGRQRAAAAANETAHGHRQHDARGRGRFRGPAQVP